MIVVELHHVSSKRRADARRAQPSGSRSACVAWPRKSPGAPTLVLGSCRAGREMYTSRARPGRLDHVGVARRLGKRVRDCMKRRWWPRRPPCLCDHARDTAVCAHRPALSQASHLTHPRRAGRLRQSTEARKAASAERPRSGELGHDRARGISRLFRLEPDVGVDLHSAPSPTPSSCRRRSTARSSRWSAPA